MSKYSSAFDFSANFKVKVAGALDPRVVAASKEDLINKNNWPSDGDTIYVYNGLIVDCGSDGVYRLIDRTKVLADDYSGWEKINGNSEEILNKIEQLNLLDFNIFNNENRLDNRYISDDGELKEIYKDKEKDDDEEIIEVEKTTPTTCYRILNNGYKKIKGTAGFYHKASRVFLGFYSDFEPTPETLIEVAKYPEDLQMSVLGVLYILDVPDNCKLIVISELVEKIGPINYEAYASMYENSEIVNNFDSIYNKLDKIESTISKNPNILELTYQEFTQLKLDYKLDIGKLYKITNYQTFIGENQYPNIPETSNIIPVIVTATGANTIDQFGETEDSIVKIELFNSYKYPETNETKIKFGNTLVSPTSNNEITYNNETYKEIKTPSNHYFYIKPDVFDAIKNGLYRPYNKIHESIFAATFRFLEYDPDYDDLMEYANYFEIIPPSLYNRGMGEILWMKDKNGNSAPWDFKSIKWKFSSDNLPEGFNTTTEYLTFDDNSFNNTILIDELTSPVILKNSYNNIINIKNSSLICIDSADNDIFVENNNKHNKINNINKSIIKLSNNNLNYVKKLSEGLFLETQDLLLDDMLNYNNEIVINKPLTGSVSFNIKGLCSLDFKTGSEPELPTIEFSGVKFIKELELVENTRYLILFDLKIQNNNKTDIVAIWAAVSNT